MTILTIKKILLDSHIELNKYFEHIDKWDDSEIRKRAETLANMAIQIWPFFGNDRMSSVCEIDNNIQIKFNQNSQDMYSEDYHLNICESRIRELYEELKNRILSISPTVNLSRNFVSIRARRSRLDIQLGLRKGEVNDPGYLQMKCN